MTENSTMSHDPRPHIHRRRHAIDRLRSLTVGAAVAGLAGTAGFGVLAAASWSGVAKAADDTGAATSGTYGAKGTGSGSTGTSGATGTNRPNAAPNTGGTAVPRATPTPRVQRSTGSGHASSGGSH
jgi:hypothetical protein